jgi:hypothetical protein
VKIKIIVLINYAGFTNFHFLAIKNWERVKGENETRIAKGIFNTPINNICIVKAIQQCQHISLAGH